MNRRWSGRAPKLDPKHIPELLEIRKARRRVAELPSVAELAERWGVSRSAVRDYLGDRLPKRYEGQHGR